MLEEYGREYPTEYSHRFREGCIPKSTTSTHSSFNSFALGRSPPNYSLLQIPSQREKSHRHQPTNLRGSVETSSAVWGLCMKLRCENRIEKRGFGVICDSHLFFFHLFFFFSDLFHPLAISSQLSPNADRLCCCFFVFGSFQSFHPLSALALLQTRSSPAIFQGQLC